VDSLLDFLARRDVVIALAIAGAVIATAGSMSRGRSTRPKRVASALVYAGYAITGASMLLFITAGFRG
jgi:hypothetical protein